tara:strand:- start:14 stop:199 length:186 start_codon:yes stop_codon:yes gene_type:complete
MTLEAITGFLKILLNAWRFIAALFPKKKQPLMRWRKVQRRFLWGIYTSSTDEIELFDNPDN